MLSIWTSAGTLLSGFCQLTSLLISACTFLLDLMALSLETAPSIVSGYSQHDLEHLPLQGQHRTEYGLDYSDISLLTVGIRIPGTLNPCTGSLGGFWQLTYTEFADWMQACRFDQ